MMMQRISRNITVSSALMDGTAAAIAMTTARGRGRP